jgi:hypothetical protein
VTESREPDPPGSTCPKCGRARDPDAQTCPRCGLMFARWSPEKAPDLLPLDDTGSRLWEQLRQGWNDEGLHDAFVKHCSTTGRLPVAGRMYRACLDRDPTDAVAGKMQGRIVAMASALMTPSQPPGPAVSRRSWFWWVLLAGGMAGVLASLLARAWR